MNDKTGKGTGTAVAHKPANLPATMENSMGAGADITADDLRPGRIYIMQPGSAFVKEDKCRQGAIIEADTFTELGYKTDKPMEMIVLKSFKYWIEKRNKEFVSRTPGKHKAEKLWEDGGIKRMFHHAFYVLLPHEIKEGYAMPYEIAFRSTALSVAERISMILFKMAHGRQKIPARNKLFEITTGLRGKGEDTWWAPDVKVGRDATSEEKNAAFYWEQQLETRSIATEDPAQYSNEDLNF